MSESKHTPGPWSFRVGKLPRTVSLKRKYWEVGAHLGKGIAIVFGDDDSHARLIAAAPDLLHELKTSRCPGGGWNGMPNGIDPTVENCIAALACGCSCGTTIAKATGVVPRAAIAKGGEGG